MENFTPGAMERLGIGYDVVSARNPRLIFASTSGFGQTGPYRERPALDIIVQAMGGVMSITGEPGRPPVRPGVSYGDLTAGLFTAVGILAALQERERSGQGQAIDISMLDCQVAVLENAIARYYVTGKAPEPIGTRHPSATPFQAFPTADGYLVIALGFGDEDQWSLLLALLGLPELVGDERYSTGPRRTARHAELEPVLSGAFRTRPTAEWLDELLALGIPCGPINNVPQVLDDPQVRHRGAIREVTHHSAGTIPIADTPVRMSRSETGIKGPPPDFGQDTAAVLHELLGIDSATVETLEARGIVATKGGPDVSQLV
jgi:CoA:oxalate CoA-transferase